MVVVFDLDDTLYPEMDYVRSAYRAIARRYGADLLPRMLAAPNAREAFDSTGIDINEILDIYRTHKPDIKLPWQSLYVLESLRLAGNIIGLATDGRSVTQRNKIEALGLEHFLRPDLIMISEEVGSGKISGEAFNRIATETKGESRYIYIGDNPEKDFIAPNGLGWLTIEVKRGGNGENIFSQKNEELSMPYRPKIIIEQLTELQGVINCYG